MILKVSPISISLGDPEAIPGPADDGAYYVRITDVPDGVSAAQVVILFAHVARRAKNKGRYEFAFSDLW